MKSLLLATLIASAEPTPEQISACFTDAMKFCSQHTGDHQAMRMCMLAHRNDVSVACREAFRK